MSKTNTDDRRAPRSALVDDDDDEPQPDRVCVGCKTVAPAERTSQSLISGRHGWRLQRIPGERGMRSIEWVCPSCWAARRARAGENELQLPPSSHERAKLGAIASTSTNDLAVLPSDLRSTGAFEMVSSVCKSLTTKLRSRATSGPTATRLLRAVGEIETEIATWSERSGTPERRAEVWAELRALNHEAEDLISHRR